MDKEQVMEKVRKFLNIPYGQDYCCGGWQNVSIYAISEVPSLYQTFFDLQDFEVISYYLDKTMRCDGVPGMFDAFVLVPFANEHYNLVFAEEVDLSKANSEEDLVELIADLEMKARSVRSELGYKHITTEELEELKRLVPSVCPGCGEKAIELQANAVFSGERLKIDDDLNLSLEQVADQPLVDEVWGWTCASCFRDGELGITYRLEL